MQFFSKRKSANQLLRTQLTSEVRSGARTERDGQLRCILKRTT